MGKLIRSTDANAEHQRRLGDWLERFPDSPHPAYDLDALASLKDANERGAAIDMAERPEVCSSYPSVVTIGNTHRCNLTCNMCFKQLDDIHNMTLPDMERQVFERLGHELFPHLRRVILTVSGEALVARDLFDQLDLMATYGVRAAITTNGMPLGRPGLLERLIPALEVLVVSMDGADEPVFNAIRRGASFTRVVQHIRRFNEARAALPSGAFRPQLHFNHILQKRNVHELPRLIELAHRLEVDHVNVEHVYLHEGLNPDDSLDGTKQLANRMLDEASRIARRLDVAVRLPDPLSIEEGYEEEPYAPLDDEVLLAEGAHRLDTVVYDPRMHARPYDARTENVRAEFVRKGGSNREFVESLLRRGLLHGELQWGLPQLGSSLIPPNERKVSACLYPWRESFVDYNGAVVPCCNPAMNAGRLMGDLTDGRSFLDIWNGPVYRRLRRSLSTGRSYRFCRYCHLVESVDEAAWGAHGSWPFDVTAVLEHAAAATVASIPTGRRLVLKALRSDSVPADARLEVYLDSDHVAQIVPVEGEEAGTWTFSRPLEDTVIEGDQVLSLRASGAGRLSVRLVGELI